MNYPTPPKNKKKTIPLQWEEDQKGARNVENHSKQAMEQQEKTKTKQSKNIALVANPGVCSTGAQDQTVQEVDHMESGSVTTVQEDGRMESGTADTGPGPVAWKAAAAQAEAWQVAGVQDQTRQDKTGWQPQAVDQLIVPLGAWQLQMVDQLVDLVAGRTLQSNQKTQGSAGAALLSPLRKQTVWEQDPCRLDELT